MVGELFASAALRRYSPGIVALVEDLNQELLAVPAPIALVPWLRRFAFGVIATTVLGLDGADRDALFEDFEIWCQGLFSFPFALPGSPFARARQARQRLLRRLGSVLQKAQVAAASRAPSLIAASTSWPAAWMKLASPWPTTTWQSSFCYCCSPATKPPPPP